MDLDQAATNLAQNIRSLRENRGLTQIQVARLAGIPRPTLTNLESGAANPTLAVLMKVAMALNVRLDELLGRPRVTGRLYPCAELPVKKRGTVLVRKLLPEAIPGLEIERMELEPGAMLAGTPHTPGTREYLTCERGSIELTVGGGDRFVLEPGDVVVFRGDQRHGYRNLVRKTTIAYSVVTFAAVP